MTLPLVALAIGALFAGWIGLPAILGGSQFSQWLEPVMGGHAEEHASHALELGLMVISIAVAAGGFFIAYLMYYWNAVSPERFTNFAGGFFYRLFDRKYYLDEFYQTIFVNGTLLLARIGSLFDQ